MNVYDVLALPVVNSVSIEHEKCGSIRFVTCKIKRNYYKSCPVSTVSLTEEDSIKKCVNLLGRVIELEEIVKILSPSHDKQPFNKGYYREILFENYEVEFKNIDEIFYITGIRKKLDNGFYLVDEPYPIPPNTIKIKDDLYEWNDLGPLCGSSGKMIVKYGLVIATKTECIS